MKFRQLGFDAVSPFGWSVSSAQLSILVSLKPRGVVYLPDKDKYEEGKKVASSIAERLWVKYPALPVLDPELLTANQIQALL